MTKSPAKREPTKAASLLIVDDDQRFCDRLGRAMSDRGFEVETAYSVSAARDVVASRTFAFAVVDLKLDDGSGLEFIRGLRDAKAKTRVIILTGYGNIATAVAAVKIGAADYLAKPASADQVAAALLEREDLLPAAPELPMSAERVRWEHIQRIYEQCDRNVSETARRLRMHRRTLQRILAKHAPKG